MTEPAEQRSLVLATKPLADALERNPYALVAGAIGVGYVLGGGLFTRLTARIANAVLRLGVSAMLPQVTEEVLRIASHELRGRAPAAKDGPTNGESKPT